jgi:divalent metal cation (Fe/Co/Zn/Cd) transporter
MLLGESATEEDVAAIRAALAAEGLGDVIHLRTVHLGPDDILLTAKIAQAPGVTVAEHSEQVDRAEIAIRAAVPAVRLIYLEPDVRRED